MSDHAKKRGQYQLGTIGAGNHFVYMQIVIEDKESIILSSYNSYDSVDWEGTYPVEDFVEDIST